MQEVPAEYCTIPKKKFAMKIITVSNPSEKMFIGAINREFLKKATAYINGLGNVVNKYS